MRTVHSLLFLLMLFVAGCSVGIGIQIEDFKPAQGPQGVHIELRLKGKVIGGNTVSGELLAVRADRILLNVIDNPDSPNAKSRVVLIPVSMVKTAELEQMYRVKVRSKRKELGEEQVNQLRLVARFPQGLSDKMLAVLLADLGQDRVDDWASNLAP